MAYANALSSMAIGLVIIRVVLFNWINLNSRIILNTPHNIYFTSIIYIWKRIKYENIYFTNYLYSK